MQGQRLIKLGGDAFDGVKGVTRILQDHRNPVAAQRLPATGVQGQQIVAQHVKPVGAYDTGFTHQTHQGAGGHGLAGAGFPHQRQPLVAKRKAQVVDHACGGVVDIQRIDDDAVFSHAVAPVHRAGHRPAG